MGRKSEDAGDVQVLPDTRTRERTQRPRLYKVLFHNDNYTTMEFVVAVLRQVFHRSESDAMAIMLNVHRQGVGVAGVYTWEIAETKVRTTEALAREHEFPLKLSLEPEDG